MFTPLYMINIWSHVLLACSIVAHFVKYDYNTTSIYAFTSHSYEIKVKSLILKVTY